MTASTLRRRALPLPFLLLPFLPLVALVAGCATARVEETATYHVRTACGSMRNCFPRIQAALDAADADRSGRWVVVDVGAGVFTEKVVMRRSRVRLVGQGADRTRLRFGAVAEHAARYDRGGWGTAGSATLTVDGDDVAIDGITVENSFDYLANDALPAGDPRRIGNAQGVAVLLDIHSDRVLFDRVSLLGYQDTLFAHGGRAFVRDSVVAGNIDFIFGSGMLLIEDSEIRSRRRAAPTAPGDFASFVVAPSTPLSQPVGIVVHRSRLTREPGVADGSVALGRPWHPTTTFADGRYADPLAVGQASFIDCYMDAHIHADHWTGMAGTARDGTKSRIFQPSESRFFETGSRGPGARRRDVGVRWDKALGIDGGARDDLCRMVAAAARNAARGDAALTAAPPEDWMRSARDAASGLRADTRGAPGARHSVYVVLLHRPGRRSPWGLYVGQTGIDPDLRFDQHKSGYRASGAVRRCGTRLLLALSAHLNPMQGWEALELEAALAEAFRAAGIDWVEGGH